jgi:hypothetical protein
LAFPFTRVRRKTLDCSRLRPPQASASCSSASGQSCTSSEPLIASFSYL